MTAVLVLACLSLSISALMIAANCIRRERSEIERRKKIELRGHWNKGRSVNPFCHERSRETRFGLN
jgi:hypothetical protein